MVAFNMDGDMERQSGAEQEKHFREAHIWMARLAMMMSEAAASDDPQYEFINEAYLQAQTDLQLYDTGRHESHYHIG